MTFKVYFEIVEELEIENSLDIEIKHIMVADKVDEVTDYLNKKGFTVNLKKIDREY